MKIKSTIYIIATLLTVLFCVDIKGQCTANFSYTLNAAGSVSFTNLSSSTVSNTIYYWNFGDYQTTNQTSPTHTYNANGNYVVTLTVNDSILPCTNTFTQTITITNAICLINANYTQNVTTNGNASFYNQTTGQIPSTSYTLNFGDGNFAYYNFNGFNMANHTYTANGTYTASLVAENSLSCANIYTTIVNINIQPCNLTSSFTYTVNNGIVNFSNTSVGTTSLSNYFWDFGNSAFSNAVNPPPQTYLYNGQYTVSLFINDSIISGCSNTSTQIININNAPCFATSNFTMLKDSSALPAIVWNAYPNYPPNVSTVTWNWGDNSFSTGLFPSHTYSAAGVYNICLTVSVSCGSSTTTCLNTNIFRTSNNSTQLVSIHVINLTTGLINVSESNTGIRLYPNPAKDILNIENAGSDYTVTLLDLLGKIVYKNSFTNNDTKIELQNLNSGIYFVKISASNYSKSIKLIKE